MWGDGVGGKGGLALEQGLQSTSSESQIFSPAASGSATPVSETEPRSKGKRGPITLGCLPHFPLLLYRLKGRDADHRA